MYRESCFVGFSLAKYKAKYKRNAKDFAAKYKAKYKGNAKDF